MHLATKACNLLHPKVLYSPWAPLFFADLLHATIRFSLLSLRLCSAACALAHILCDAHKPRLAPPGQKMHHYDACAAWQSCAMASRQG